MTSNKLAILVLLVGTIGACGGRSALRAVRDGGEAADSRGLSDGSSDGVRQVDGPRDSALRDGPFADGPGGDSAPTDTRRTDVSLPTDLRDGGLADSGAPDAMGDAAPTLTNIEVAPPSPTIAVGVAYTGLVVTAIFSNGSTTDVTGASTFASSDTTIVQVSGHTLTGQRAGSATITVTYRGDTATAKVTVTSSPLQSISIEGAAPVPLGQSILITATGVFADGTKQDITAEAAWASSNTSLATVALDSASSKERVTGIKAGTLTVTATLAGITGTASIAVTAAPMTRIDITPTQSIIQRGVSQQFQATATYADGTTGDVTQLATWATSDASVAAVTSGASGVIVRALGSGTATISATVGTITGSTTVTVTTPTLLSIALAPPTWSPEVGGTQNFTATGTYSDNSTADLTVSATWSSTNDAAVAVSNAAGEKGKATALADGNALLQATFSGVTGTATVRVSSSPLVSIAVTPNPLALVLGLDASLVATGTYQNGTTQILTAQVAWTVADPTIASVSNAAGTAGLVASLAVGSTTVTATLSGISGKAAITVAQAKLISIAVAPTSANISAGTKQPFTASGTYDNGATPDLTTQVTWTSSDITVAQVSNAAGSNGVATSLVAGTSTITASLDGVSGSATLTVGAPLLTSVMIAPASASIEVGNTQAFTVTAVYQNGTTAAVAGTWSSSDIAVATVAAGAGGRRVVATGVAAGTTSITVTYQGLTDSATLTVTAAPTLVGLTVTPANPASILVGATQQFQASAVFSNGTTTVVTGSANWTSSDANVASVSNGGGGPGGGGPGGGGRGLATGVGAGTATITATYSGFTATATITVRNPTPTGLTITPSAASVVVNGTRQFVASVELDDGTTQTVTGAASWTTSDGTIASITTGGGPGGGGGRGLATGIAGGTVTITATYGGFTATASLTVTAATPTGIVLTPASPSIQVGQTQAFVATLVYSDNTTSVVTAQATWSSSDPSVATVTTPGGGPGPGGGGGGGTATAIAKGSATITATYGGLSGTATLTVTDPPLAYVQVTPTNPSIPVQATTQFIATAVFTDFSTRNVTALATWSSSDTSVAVVANAGAAIGRASALAEGTATITATYQGSSGTSLLTVAGSVKSLAVTPTSPTTVLGLPVAFVATAILSNTTTLVVTGSASWVTSDATVATVTAAGIVTPVKSGTVTVTATYLGQSGTSTLTVSPATLSAIAITPNPLSLTTNGSQQLTATGTYSDATTRDLTGVVTWLSSSPAVATVSNAAGSRGLLTATGVGTTTVTAAFQGVTSSNDLVSVSTLLPL